MLIKAGEPQRNIGGRAFIVLLVALVTLMPTYSAFAEIHATPVVKPTALPGAPETIQTPTPLGTPEPGSDIQGSGTISPLGAESGPGVLVCLDGPDFIEPGLSVTFECSIDMRQVPVSLLNLTIVGLVNWLEYQSPPQGIDVSIAFDHNLLGFLNVGTLTSDPLEAGEITGEARMLLPVLGLLGLQLSSVTVYITVHADETAVRGTTFDTHYTACADARTLARLLTFTCENTDGSAKITLSVAEEPAVGTHYTFSCEPVNPYPVNLYVTAESICILSAGVDLGAKSVRVDKIESTISSTPGTWSSTLTNLNDVPLISSVPGSLEYTSGNPIVTSTSGPFRFKVKMTPTSCVTQGSGPEVGVRLDLMLVEGMQELGLGSPTELVSSTTTFDPSTAINVAIDSPVSEEFDYSMTTAYEGDAQFEIRLDVVGCTAWSADATIAPFVKQGDADYEGLTPDLLEVNHNSSPVPFPGTFRLDSADTPGANGTYNRQSDHIVNLEYIVSANTPVGTYQSTITVTVPGAP